MKWFKPPRELKFTPLGTVVVLLTVGVGLAAMNTGNNLVYMVFGMMLGFITVSGILSEMSLRGLKVDTIIPSEIFAKNCATLRLILKNEKRRSPSFCIEASFKLISKEKEMGKIENTFLYLPAKCQSFADIPLTLPHRGLYRLEKVRLETQFPFGFFRKALYLPLKISLIVYPEIVLIRKSDLETLDREERQPLFVKGIGESFWGLREFVPGDSPKQISWKSSAKSSRLMVRETEKEREKSVILTLEPLKAWRNLSRPEVESAISFVASFAKEMWKEGYTVQLQTLVRLLEPLRSKNGLDQIYRTLSLFDPISLNEISVIRNYGTTKPIEILTLWNRYKSIR